MLRLRPRNRTVKSSERRLIFSRAILTIFEARLDFLPFLVSQSMGIRKQDLLHPLTTVRMCCSKCPFEDIEIDCLVFDQGGSVGETEIDENLAMSQ
jgi:hypothetical protein